MGVMNCGIETSEFNVGELEVTLSYWDDECGNMQTELREALLYGEQITHLMSEKILHRLESDAIELLKKQIEEYKLDQLIGGLYEIR